VDIPANQMNLELSAAPKNSFAHGAGDILHSPFQIIVNHLWNWWWLIGTIMHFSNFSNSIRERHRACNFKA
jgi:hypothetical protein